MDPKTEIRKVHHKRTKTAKKRGKRLQYFRQYYRDHKQEITAQKKKRYEEDSEYREAIKSRDRKVKKDRSQLLAERMREGHKGGGKRGTRRSKRVTNAHARCPICHRPMPRARTPRRMLIGQKYEVLMYTSFELQFRLGRTARSITKWHMTKVLPDATYHFDRGGFGHSSKARLWTQDQIEAIVRVYESYDLRAPVSLKGCGFVGELHAELGKLDPLGIDVSLYTEPGEHDPVRHLQRKVKHG